MIIDSTRFMKSKKYFTRKHIPTQKEIILTTMSEKFLSKEPGIDKISRLHNKRVNPKKQHTSAANPCGLRRAAEDEDK